MLSAKGNPRASNLLGVISALQGISLTVKQGSIVTLIGANGAGKTTTLKAISGLLKARGGEILYQGRNITNLLALAPGVTTSGSGSVQMNGVAAGGTGVTVDVTEANSNPEARSLSQYGGQNQISVMSIEAVAEVQIVKGIMPAEYGGAVADR